ncbi:MAG: ATPase P [Desulfovibrionaceae bacterium]|nr:ATPase P [Desulfovibrionaceae bacterium]
MIELDIPGFGRLKIERLVLDYNGTLALDGRLQPGVAEAVRTLARDLEVHVLTADTFGRCREALSGLPVTLHILGPGAEDRAKLDYVRGLGAGSCACLGNGANDRLMLKGCGLGVAVIGPEGVSVEALGAARVAVTDILRGLDLFRRPARLAATLRS